MSLCAADREMGRERSDSDAYYAEAAADEIYSGPTNELIPSSYSSFHHGMAGDGFELRRRRSSLGRQADSSMLSPDNGEEPGFPRSSRLSRSSRSDSVSSFHFFSRDEVEHAEGSSTVAVVDFEDEQDLGLLPLQSPMKHHGHHGHHVHPEPHQYFEDSDDQEPLLTSGEAADEYEYPSTRVVQKYYIAEEDMRIVCAGYKKVTWRRYCYYLFCIATFGLGYLFLRWFPRQKITWLARPCPLGNSDLMVVENQWGELEFLDVQTRWYNEPLSTIFRPDATPTAPPTAAASTTSLASNQQEDDYVDPDPNVPYIRTVEYRYLRFHYNPIHDLFMTNTDWMSATWTHEDSAAEGLDSDKADQREMVFGKNHLDIRQPTTLQLLVDEVLHPFYIFQVFSIVLWLFDEYVYYAAAIFIISLFSIAEAFIETRSSYRRLSDIAKSESEIRVLRSGFWSNMSSDELVPGDVFELSDPNLSLVPCDAILLSGDCIVNESILTGESVPVSKVAADSNILTTLYEYGVGAVSRSFLYSGTKLIRVRKPALVDAEEDLFDVAQAMVVRTGFTTTKGSLVRSMMFPRPSGFKFYRDSFRYIGVMAAVALAGFIFSAIGFIRMGMQPYLIIVRALDLITIVVPPALPATLTIGTNIALARLRKKDTFCITPSRLNVGGRLDVVCFDKTGTLTEDGLDVLGVHLINREKGKFGSLLTSASQIPDDDPLLDAITTCHELRDVHGELLGDHLDVKMFEFSGWQFNENERHGGRTVTSPSGTHMSVVKQFEFVSALRRMSVAVSGPSGLCVLTKGAPEVMRDICRKDSFPRGFDDLLHEYTHRGYRVIACASRKVGDLSDFNRELLETDLDFAGFIVFENKLKPSSKSVIQELDEANIRTIMCTGDNVLTAISVGKECCIVPKGAIVYAAHFDEQRSNGTLRWESVDNSSVLLDPDTLIPMQAPSSTYTLAVTGEIFSYVIQHGTQRQLEQMLIKTSIYARMSPDEKHELVARLQSIDYTTCFCGDGANDCGALKEADVGISLSEAEASVAAPFTSRKFEISCVLDVIKEGRAALSTSFSCFKYMSLYSAIQFVTVTILYSYGTNIGDFQFLYIDLFLIVPIAVFMAWSGPSPVLARKRPGAKLVSRKVLVPLIGAMVILSLFQIIIWKYGQAQDWYVAPVPGDNDNLKSTDNTALFDLTTFQYIFSGIILCEGMPYRRPVFTNLPFIGTCVLTTALSVFFVFLDPDTPVGRLMDLSPTSTKFKFVVLGLAVANYLAMLAAGEWVYGPICSAIKRAKKQLGHVQIRKRYKQLMEYREHA